MGFEHHDLGGGNSVDLRTSLTHGQNKTILAAVARANRDPGLAPDVVDGYLVAFVISWQVKDEAGTAIEWPADEPGQRLALNRAPEGVTDAIFDLAVAAFAAWKKDADPNDTSATSPESPAA